VAAAAVVLVGGAVTACWAGGAAGLAGGGSASRSACRFVSPPFPFKALNQVEHGSVGVGQTPAGCCDLCLSGVPRLAAHFLQIFWILYLLRGEFKKHRGCPLP